MPIQWTEQRTTEDHFQLRTMKVGDGMYPPAATLDDLAAAIRGMGEEEKKHIFHACELGDPCRNCCKERDKLRMERDEALHDLVDTRNALEIAKAEAERLRICNSEYHNDIGFLRIIRGNLEGQVSDLANKLEALGKEHKAWMGEVDSLNRERTELRAKLEARNQELDNQKAEIDRMKANQIPIEVEPEWVRRMPEWMKVVLRIPLGDTDSTNPIFLTRDMIRSLLNAQSDLSDKHRDGYACGPLRLVARDALRAAYLARKAGGE